MTEPEQWMILKFITEDIGTFYKVFGIWMGGYLDPDKWKLNSGIAKVEVYDDFYHFIGYSGSIYKCNKKAYGTNLFGSSIIASCKNYVENAGAIFKVLENTDFTKLLDIPE